MNIIEKKGRAALLFWFGAALLLSLSIIVWFNVSIGPQNLFPQSVRFLARCVLMWFTFSGSRVAKWLLCALYTFETVQAYSNLLSADTKLAVYFFGALGAFHVGFILSLLFSKSIVAFLDFKETQS